MGKFEEIIITLSWIRLIQQQCVHFYYYDVGTKMCKRCFKRIQFFPLTEFSTQNNVVPPILSSSYQSWVVPAPVLLSMGGCCRVTPTAWGLDGGLWWLAGLRMGWMGARVGPDGIRMGARGRLGLPPDSGGTVRPNTTRASKVPNNHKPTPSDFISIETFDLGHHTLSFLAAQQLYTYTWCGRTE